MNCWSLLAAQDLWHPPIRPAIVAILTVTVVAALWYAQLRARVVSQDPRVELEFNAKTNIGVLIIFTVILRVLDAGRRINYPVLVFCLAAGFVWLAIGLTRAVRLSRKSGDPS